MHLLKMCCRKNGFAFDLDRLLPDQTRLFSGVYAGLSLQRAPVPILTEKTPCCMITAPSHIGLLLFMDELEGKMVNNQPQSPVKGNKCACLSGCLDYGGRRKRELDQWSYSSDQQHTYCCSMMLNTS